MKITRRVKTIEQEDYFKLLDQFINDTAKGFRMRSNGKMIKRSTAENYEVVKRLLSEFTISTDFKLKLYLVNHLTKSENEEARRYSHSLYLALSGYLYEKDCFDNYVGNVFTIMKTFYNYLVNERNINVGPFHKKFFIPRENIPIVVLSPQQLNYLIFNRELDSTLDWSMRKVKDIFVFGCTVALRACDLLKLQEHNLRVKNGEYVLNVTSSKTQIQTNIKLPDYAIAILKKYKGRYKTLLPPVSMTDFNRKLKVLGTYINMSEPMVKMRSRKGELVTIFKDPVKKTHYTMSDHITTHTMRRTAVTTMLLLGMNEQIVRKISGHAPSSSEFYKYVKYTEKIVNNETDQFFEKLIKASLKDEPVEQLSLF